MKDTMGDIIGLVDLVEVVVMYNAVPYDYDNAKALAPFGSPINDGVFHTISL